ncbi:MAG: DUF975 family protein [Bacilli bacterium]|nr:DUF975 family protein [Bacilli bacterium]
MDVQELKDSIKPKVENHIFSLFGIFLCYIISKILFPISIFLFFVEPGVNYYIVRFNHDKSVQFKDIFRYIDEMWDYLWTGLLRDILVLIGTIFFIIPGLIQHYNYALVPLLLMDEDFDNMRGRKLLNLSRKIMTGHLMECFILDMSFLPLHLLSILTLGFLEIYVSPYHMAAKYILLYEIKTNYTGEEASFMMESNAIYTPVGVIHQKTPKALEIHRDQEGNFVAKYCLKCGTPLEDNSRICNNCGYEYQDDPDIKI